jgi:hypothetical protein
MKKPTRATLKSFINKNRQRLFVQVKSQFDGMVDGIRQVEHQGWIPAMEDRMVDHTYGVQGVWVVGGGRDYIREYQDDIFKGFEVSNCCGRFVVGVKG